MSLIIVSRCFSAAIYRLDLTAVTLHELSILLEDLRVAQNGVQRRPEFMALIGEKFAFRAI